MREEMTKKNIAAWGSGGRLLERLYDDEDEDDDEDPLHHILFIHFILMQSTTKMEGRRCVQ